MSPEIGQIPVQKTGQSQKIKTLQEPRAAREIYGRVGIEQPEDDFDKDSVLAESPEYEDYEEEEDDFAPDASGGEYPEEPEDPSFVPFLSLMPPKWLWVAKTGGSRLLWAAAELTPRLGALEVFRLFLEEALDAVYFAEKGLFTVSQAKDYSPPSPLDLENFFLQEWLEDLLKTPSKSSGQFPVKHLSSFTIAVPAREGCFFVKPDSLIYGMGSPKGAGTLREALLKRWARLEMETNGWTKEDFTGGGKFLRRTSDYAEKLNSSLEPLLGDKFPNPFRPYEGRSLYAPAEKLREIL
jgi:hypothetical protein